MRRGERAFTLIELMLGVMTITVAIVAILGAYLGQITLSEHAKNLSLATHDANRILEQIRLQNSGVGCTTPSAAIAGGWDAWLRAQNPGKSWANVNEEAVIVTCQDADGGALASDHCGANQISGSWTYAPGPTTLDPIRVTVTVCWQHRGRTLGECTWNGATLSASDTDGDGVVESPAMLTTLVTCRG